MNPLSILAVSVTFSGLILHYETDSVARTRRAVLISHSQPVLLILDTDRVRDLGTWKGTLNNGVWGYDLRKKRVAITPLTGGVTTTSNFQNRVPRLPEMVGMNQTANLEDEVVRGAALHRDTDTYIEYAGGTLDIGHCHMDEITFDPPVNGDPRCLASTVSLTQSSGEWAIVERDNPANGVVIRSSGAAVVFNRVPGRGHYKQYARILKKQGNGSPTTIRDMKFTGSMCVLSCTPQVMVKPPVIPLPIRILGPTVECSSTQWP
jgi:hypothetical protein